MISNLLDPVNPNLLEQCKNNESKHVVGNNIIIRTQDEELESYDIDIALVFVEENRGSVKKLSAPDFDQIRYSLYKMFLGSWDVRVADLGNLPQGAIPMDSYESLSQVIDFLLKKGINPVVIGGSQDNLYGMYRAYDNVKKGVNIASVDSCFDFDMLAPNASQQNYMGKIIKEEPLNLFNFVNIGYQTYYNAQEEIDLVEKLLFSAYRLGDVSGNIRFTEHIYRNTDIANIDLIASLKFSEIHSTDRGVPNGFDAREICALSRYAGISDMVTSFGVFEIPDSYITAQLVSQMIWYFIEGFNYREVEIPNTNDDDFERYIVLLENQEVFFFKSKVTERWWIEFIEEDKNFIYPCAYEDYLQANKGILSDSWIKIWSKLAT